MLDLSTRYDAWHTVLTLVPVGTGMLGALYLTRWPHHIGRFVIVYAALCVGIAFSPVWLAGTVSQGAPLRPLLEETRLAFVLGLSFLLAAAGRALERQ